MDLELYIKVPNVGSFKVIIEKGKINYYTLSIGGKTKKCLNITIPTDITDKNIQLGWVEASDNCSIDTIKIKGSKTYKMIVLAITIAKKIEAHVENVLLDDESNIYCETPSGKRKIYLPYFYLAFHRKTWYEDKFGAVIKDPVNRDKYKESVENFYKPSMKPSFFPFIHPELEAVLAPLYNNSTTWSEFFDLIAEKFKDKKCAMVYPWLLNAISHIFKGSRVFEREIWTFDITPDMDIKYYHISNNNIKSGGGNQEYFESVERPMPSSDIMAWKYNKFIRNKNKSRKNKIIIK